MTKSIFIIASLLLLSGCSGDDKPPIRDDVARLERLPWQTQCALVLYPAFLIASVGIAWASLNNKSLILIDRRSQKITKVSK